MVKCKLWSESKLGKNAKANFEKDFKLMNNGNKKCPRKRKHKFEGYKHCLQANQLDKSKNIKKQLEKTWCG